MSRIVNLKLTTHFQARMVERGIDIDHVKKALRSPDQSGTTYDNKKFVRKKVGSKTIEVIYYKDSFKDKPDTYILITAYYK